jgi:hypothetical protein
MFGTLPTSLFYFLESGVRRGTEYSLMQSPSDEDKKNGCVLSKVVQLIRGSVLTQTWAPHCTPMGFLLITPSHKHPQRLL